MKSAIFKRIIASVMLIFNLFVCCAAALSDTYQVSSDIDALNVRDAECSEVIYGAIRAGKKIDVKYTKGDWAYLTYKGKDCKVYKPYLEPVSSSKKSSSTPAKKTTTKKTAPATTTSTTFGTKYRFEASSSSTQKASMIYVVSDKVKKHLTVRNSKSTKAKALGTLQPGDKIYVIACGYRWARVIYNDQEGFVLSQYIEKVSLNLPDEGETYKVVVKEGTTLNVRPEPNKNQKYIARIPNGSYVKVIEKVNDDWSLVYYGMNETGYVSNDFIEASDF